MGKTRYPYLGKNKNKNTFIMGCTHTYIQSTEKAVFEWKIHSAKKGKQDCQSPNSTTV